MADSSNLPIDPRRYQRDKARVEKGFWAKVRRTLGRVPFLEEAVAAYYCAIDRETPVQVKAILMGALAYFVLPLLDVRLDAADGDRQDRVELAVGDGQADDKSGTVPDSKAPC